MYKVKKTCNKKIAKKILALLMALLLSFNNFAAIVSDNDGSSFLTKSEFESMKSDFNDQIENYQNSIDGKIDGAIASYLAGIKMSNLETPENLIESVEAAWGKKILWSGATSVETDITKTHYITNKSEFLVSVIYAVGTNNRVGLYTLGYGPSADAYKNGYRVLKLSNSTISKCVLYKPSLTYSVAYQYATTGDHSASLSSWSSLTNFGESQKFTDVKYWIGYMDNVDKVPTDISTGGWGVRTVSVSYVGSDKVTDFLMAPLATTTVSVWDPENTDKTATGSGSLGTSKKVYESDITGGTNPDTQVQSAKSEKLYTTDYTNTLPWVTQSNSYCEQNLNLNDNSVYPCKMKYGLPVIKSDKEATLKFRINGKKGKIGWYKNTPTEYNNIPSKQKMDITTAGEINGEISVEKDDVVFFIYLPDTISQLEFKSLVLETSN